MIHRAALPITTILATIFTAPALAQVVISQVHAESSIYANDFVELYNKGSAPVNLAGWSLQYASGASSGFQSSTLSGTIPARSYYLVQCGFFSGVTPLPSPDDSGDLFIAASTGKLFLANDSVLLSGTCPNPDSIVNLVGFGTTNCAEAAAAAPGMSSSTALFRAAAGCTDTNNNAADFAIAAPGPRNSSSNLNCAGFTDCNNNTIDDFAEVLANPALDCDNNLQIDSCESANNPAVDCNTNGRPDSCDIADNPALDCNNNGIIDCTDLRSGALTDADGDATPDACEGASVVEAVLSATVRNQGVGADDAVWLAYGSGVEDADGRPAPSFGAARWSISAITSPFDAQYGVGQWSVVAIYLHCHQANDVVTSNGSVQLHYSANDTVSLAPGSNAATYNTFAGVFAPVYAAAWTFTRGPAGGNGTPVDHLVYQPGLTNTDGGIAAAIELNGGGGGGGSLLTLLLHDASSSVAASYAGISNPSWPGPTLVVFAQIRDPCGSADFDGDGDTGTDLDIEAFFACLGGSCCATCGSADFDGDGDTGTDLDIEAFFRVLGGGSC